MAANPRPTMTAAQRAGYRQALADVQAKLPPRWRRQEGLGSSCGGYADGLKIAHDAIAELRAALDAAPAQQPNVTMSGYVCNCKKCRGHYVADAAPAAPEEQNGR